MSTVRFKNGVVGYVGSCWTSPGIFSTRVFAQAGLMHFELDFASWDEPENLRQSSSLYIQRGKDGYGLREDLKIFSRKHVSRRIGNFCRRVSPGSATKLTAHDGNVAVAMVCST